MPYRYENPPVVEGLIDIRALLPATITTEHLRAAIFPSIKEQYPVQERQVAFQTAFTFGMSVGASAEQKDTGSAFKSQENNQIFQARLDGFTLSRLKPYQSWPDLRQEAQRLWKLYAAVAEPVSITRVAVRYVNRIEIPTAEFDYRHYFRTLPEVSSDLPQSLSASFMQLQFPAVHGREAVVLTQATVPPSAPGTYSMMLDIDIFKETPNGISDGELWSLLELLRNQKNEFFEGCITDTTRLLFGAREEY